MTEDVVGDLVQLAGWLERQHYAPESVANFLMRCCFTLFAEAVGLLQSDVFTRALEERWLANPHQFKPEVEALWQAMTIGRFPGFEPALQCSSSFFADPSAFPLSGEQLQVLYRVAAKDWSQVEPTIFGTLLEQALDRKERRLLGMYYTPRSYIERLVRPVVMEPLRCRWELEIEPELQRLLAPRAEKDESSQAQKTKAETLIRCFLQELRQLKVLDPACGCGNFLYVALDLLKRLEKEVIARLAGVMGDGRLNVLGEIDPSQFLGIEIDPRAAAIAELAIWIGYLQWHCRRCGKVELPELVFQTFGNIECRDAVLAYDGKDLEVDSTMASVTGTVRSRWSGRMMTHAAPEKTVPDPTDPVTICRYLNPRPAKWPEADYVVSNPPFIGKSRRRAVLGDDYLEALFQAYQGLPESADYVMYWWHQAARLARSQRLKRFGLITTNSITQLFNRQVIEKSLQSLQHHQIQWAIPDHPWVDRETGAAVRIAMIVVGERQANPILATVVEENWQDAAEAAVKLQLTPVGKINANLSGGVDTDNAVRLNANRGLATVGLVLFGQGFLLDAEAVKHYEQQVCHPFLTGRGLVQSSCTAWAIDFYPLSEVEALCHAPRAFQRILERVKPQRDRIKDASSRKRWWRFGRDKPKLRAAIATLSRYIATVEVSKYRTFCFVDAEIRPDHTLIAIALEDAYFLGVLSSQIHQVWSLTAGGSLEDRPRYNKSLCFDPFPFPDPTPAQKQYIRTLGERLDAHRKQVQTTHPGVTMTDLYNWLEKLRAGEPFAKKEPQFNPRALVTPLKHIHDELNAAVLDAYGWPPTLSNEAILERLVTLNAERAEEERNGFVRWLRQDYQHKL